uniref:Beta-1,4-galactosyltransferase 1 n=1 Tax=Larimichthys crocea TaxID=215358 RepID=A0A0F8AR16_LARCR
MKKKLFYTLSLFTLLSVAGFLLFLHFSNYSSVTLLTVYHAANENISLSSMIQKHGLIWKWTDTTNARQEKTQMPSNTSKSLGPCPDTPPGLKGPLNVDFNYKLTLDKVRKNISSPLKEGGRYKPLDCIARQKSQFLKINGFPNTFWGWGGEDDDIYQRVIFHEMSISRPDLVTGKYKMIKHERDLHNERNPVNADKLKRTKSTMNEDGINSLNYTVKEIVKDILYTWITVDIQAPLTTKI